MYGRLHVTKKKQPFHRPTRIEAEYRRYIDQLLDKFFDMPNFTTLGEINARLVEIANAKNFLESWPAKLAKRMVTQTLATNANNWRQAASQSSNGRQIYLLLKDQLTGNVGNRVDELIAENATLIKSLPQTITGTIVKHIQTQVVAGLRPEEIIKQLKPKMREMKAYQIARLARTEVAKADTAITRARAEDLGLNWYQWVTSEDARVRKGHKLMDKILINWNNPPSPEALAKEKSEGHYHAGNIYNCRCIALPITSLDEISWPCKVYTNGAIKRLTRRQFLLISGISLTLAA